MLQAKDWTIISRNERSVTYMGRHFFAVRCSASASNLWKVEEIDQARVAGSRTILEVGSGIKTRDLSEAVMQLAIGEKANRPICLQQAWGRIKREPRTEYVSLPAVTDLNSIEKTGFYRCDAFPETVFRTEGLLAHDGPLLPLDIFKDGRRVGQICEQAGRTFWRLEDKAKMAWADWKEWTGGTGYSADRNGAVRFMIDQFDKENAQ